MERKTVELDVVKEKRVQRQQMSQALVEYRCKTVNTQQTVTMIDAMHVSGVRSPPRNYQQGYQNGEGGGKNEGRNMLPKARPYCRHSSHLTVCGDSMGTEHSIPTPLCRRKWWTVLTTRVQENQCDRTCIGLWTMILQGPSLPKTA